MTEFVATCELFKIMYIYFEVPINSKNYIKKIRYAFLDLGHRCVVPHSSLEYASSEGLLHPVPPSPVLSVWTRHFSWEVHSMSLLQCCIQQQEACNFVIFLIILF